MSFLDPVLVSAGVVALAEIGDKTQLLAIVLAARFRRPVPIILGILAATLANHALAATAGYFVASFGHRLVLQLAVGVGLVALADRTLAPEQDADSLRGRSVR